MTYLSVQFPFFNIPVVKQITRFIVRKIISIIINKTELGLTMIHNILHTTAQGKDFIQSVHNYAEVVKHGTPEEIEAAKKDKIDKARNLIRLNR